MLNNAKYFFGRSLLREEFPDRIQPIKEESKVQSVKLIGDKVICQRCGSEIAKDNVCLRVKQLYYCDRCLVMGRASTKNSLYRFAQKKEPRRRVNLTWEGQLTSAQARISKNLIRAYRHKKNHLVHAVTGAGKTEMLFPLIKRVLSDGKQIAIASPRVDVCLELYPRLKAAFVEEEITLLYGGAEEVYCYSPLILCTTHQLLRFYHAFDVIVIDEVDSFPYAGDAALFYGTKQAKKRNGVLFFLTATPSDEILAYLEETNGRISCLNRRFHGVDLPVPKYYWVWNLTEKMYQNKIPVPLMKLLSESSRQLLLFFPSINLMEKYCQTLRQTFPHKRIMSVHAADEEREKKIIMMREEKIDWLLTTTILERGVTFPNIDVIIIQAEHRVYTTASLVQISGRVGRSPLYPTGIVAFVHSGKSRAMKAAVTQIKKMNRGV